MQNNFYFLSRLPLKHQIYIALENLPECSIVSMFCDFQMWQQSPDNFFNALYFIERSLSDYLIMCFMKSIIEISLFNCHKKYIGSIEENFKSANFFRFVLDILPRYSPEIIKKVLQTHVETIIKFRNEKIKISGSRNYKGTRMNQFSAQSEIFSIIPCLELLSDESQKEIIIYIFKKDILVSDHKRFISFITSFSNEDIVEVISTLIIYSRFFDGDFELSTGELILLPHSFIEIFILTSLKNIESINCHMGLFRFLVQIEETAEIEDRANLITKLIGDFITIRQLEKAMLEHLFPLCQNLLFRFFKYLPIQLSYSLILGRVLYLTHEFSLHDRYAPRNLNDIILTAKNSDLEIQKNIMILFLTCTKYKNYFLRRPHLFLEILNKLKTESQIAVVPIVAALIPNTRGIVVEHGKIKRQNLNAIKQEFNIELCV